MELLWYQLFISPFYALHNQWGTDDKLCLMQNTNYTRCWRITKEVQYVMQMFQFLEKLYMHELKTYFHENYN